ncbi:hypothetical protein BX666DRAFT_2011347 [Dichotomocladium elegans]|nr:hypothetical protein BX666DRAFT_2011347 [Dichotomocladium elegans]
MSLIPINSFANEALKAHISKNALSIYNLFALQIIDRQHQELADALVVITPEQYESSVRSILDDTSVSLSEMTIAYMRLVQAFSAPLDAAYDSLESFYTALVPLFSSADGTYLVPYVKWLSAQLVTTAFSVDKQFNLRGKYRKANGAARLLSRMFNLMLTDRGPLSESKRRGILQITNLAFKIYTKLDNDRLCQTFISNLKKGGIEITDFELPEQVTYRYYMGRFEYYQNNLKEAEGHFSFAFRHCPNRAWRNKRLILEFLIPTRMILGRMPKDELLNAYNLMEPYASLRESIRKGDIHGYLTTLDSYMDYLSRKYAYLLLRGRGIVLVWRSLLRRIFVMTHRATNEFAISFKACSDAVHISSKSDEYDFFDIENLLVSLISQGYIRGYLHHEKQQMICSKKNPFPTISEVRLLTEQYNDDLAQDHLSTMQPEIPQEVDDILRTNDEGSAEEEMGDLEGGDYMYD